MEEEASVSKQVPLKQAVVQVIAGLLLGLTLAAGILIRRLRRPAHDEPATRAMADAPPRTGDTAELVPPTAPEAEVPPDVQSRRRFLTRVSVIAGGGAATTAAIPLVGFLLTPLRRAAPPVWRPVGSVDDFIVGDTVKINFLDAAPLPWAGFASQSAAWLRRTDDQEFTAFSGYCTHVGCPVRWLPEARLFMCPCHGGVFYHDGAVAAGPPPVGLARYPVRVRGDQVEIQSSPIPLPE
jgi:menaquinol-cytochrome c reductase iron-sulfur subunit